MQTSLTQPAMRAATKLGIVRLLLSRRVRGAVDMCCGRDLQCWGLLALV